VTGPADVPPSAVPPADVPGARLLELVAIVDTLRRSCPWDREQTHASLLRYLLEEAYEAAETIEDDDMPALREEIGDVLFQVLFHARIASERSAADGGFTIDDVADTLAAKLIRRHPHVFAGVTATSAAEVNANWEEIKKAERSQKAAETESGPPSVLDGVVFGQPALSLAAQLQRRAQRAGFPASQPSPDCDVDGADGADGAGGAGDAGSATEAQEIGDELFRLAVRASSAGIDPEMQLRAAARRYAGFVRSWEQSDARRSSDPD
jgi:XTP/dITP diphosphohydrolase